MSLVWPILAHLSAEPLVGLKRQEAVIHEADLDFQPNPSWV